MLSCCYSKALTVPFLCSVRTSSGMFLVRGQDSVVSTIEHRIALHSLIPMEHGEGLQILHYEESEKYSYAPFC